MNQTTNKQLLIIALKLLVICSVVAVIVAGVNMLTKDRIEQNTLLNTASALDDIYSTDAKEKFEISSDKNSAFIMKNKDGKIIKSCIIADTKLEKDVTALYVINNAEGITDGYCVAISPMGFKDKINMLVAINSDFSVKDVKIVSMSDTKGIGTKVQDENWLSKFKGKNNIQGIDTISGATKTSKPVMNAVATAITQVTNYSTETKDGGVAK